MYSLLLSMVVATSAVCGDVASFQVLLDRHGFSPGPIDGRIAENTSHALAAFQASKGLNATGHPDCDTWKALTADDAQPAFTTYRITDEDAKGLIATAIPRDLERQAVLPALAYQSILERLAERFHVAPALLTSRNRSARFIPGTVIHVPAVTPFDEGAKPKSNAAASDSSIEVSGGESALRVIRADGTPVFFSPVTSGSEYDPLPVGQWRVTSISWAPAFQYNPELFWDADPSHSKATIKPGPNNPVGVVWIGINIEHYGLHGTPEPSTVGHTQSHGCVRLTNWDAARLAALISVGTPVIFK